MLTPPGRPSEADDGLLDASEVAALRLDADRVVLSACNTAVGSDSLSGYSLAGLADVFIRAGGRRVLASHWEVSSDATVELMTRTFAAYGRDRAAGGAVALRDAQRQLVADPEFSHPAFWAAFTLLGDGGGEAGAS